MTDRIAEIKARCEAATPGPWETANKSVRVAGSQQEASWGKYAPNGYDGGICNCLGGNSYRATKNSPVNVQARANADFIAHSREDLPWALDIIAAQQAEIDRLTEAQRWIPVTERLPREDCIIYEANAGRVWFSYAEEVDAADWNITHWMPLPAAPKGDNREND